MKECHLIPFYSKHVGKLKIEYCSLDSEETTIRGIRCIKKKIEGVPIYRDGVLLESCHQWVPIHQELAVFDRGATMCKNKLGLPKPERNLKHFLKKKRGTK